MKSRHIVAALAAVIAACGCQTRITAEKHAEQVIPVQRVVTVGGVETVITVDAVRASGGWYATARSPLWAREELRGLSIGVETNGCVRLALDAYDRDLSTNAVAVTQALVDGACHLADRICEAVTAAGQARASAAAARALAAQFVAKGGDVAKASVTCADGVCSVTDGNICAGGLCAER